MQSPKARSMRNAVYEGPGPTVMPAQPTIDRDWVCQMTGRNFSLWALFALQGFCALFFLGDGVSDALGFELENLSGFRDTDTFEYAVSVALLLSLVFTALEIRKMLGRQQRIEDQLKVASGAFAELLDDHFTAWQLTPSERDVAMLAIKGLSIADMAGMRETKEGTIKAQCNAVYRKAGVTGRPQLLSLFIEELMAESLVADTP